MHTATGPTGSRTLHPGWVGPPRRLCSTSEAARPSSAPPRTPSQSFSRQGASHFHRLGARRRRSGSVHTSRSSVSQSPCADWATVKRITHGQLNKDDKNAERSKNGNFARAYAAAVIETRQEWADFRAALIDRYGPERGWQIACLLTRIDPRPCTVTIPPRLPTTTVPASDPTPPSVQLRVGSGATVYGVVDSRAKTLMGQEPSPVLTVLGRDYDGGVRDVSISGSVTVTCVTGLFFRHSERFLLPPITYSQPLVPGQSSPTAAATSRAVNPRQYAHCRSGSTPTQYTITVRGQARNQLGGVADTAALTVTVPVGRSRLHR